MNDECAVVKVLVICIVYENNTEENCARFY